jgi:tetratricopeptide (TPR) repeat protein
MQIISIEEGFMNKMTIGSILIMLAGALLPAGQQIDQKDLADIQKYRAAAADLESGQGLLVKGKLDQAEKKFLKVLETLPEHATAAYLLADCYYKRNRAEEGLAAIQRAEANFGNLNRIMFRWQMSQINRFMNEKAQLDEQIRALQIRLASARTDLERQTLQNQITGLQGQQNSGGQRTKEQQISETYAIPADYYYLHGNLLFKKKEYQPAFEQYSKAVETDPKHGNSYNNIANLYYMSRQYEKAQEFLEKAEANGAKINPAFKEAVAKALKK